MTRRQRKTDPVRLNLCIASEVRERIERIQEKISAESMTEVVRRSLEVYESMLDLTQCQVAELRVKGKTRWVVLP